MSAFDWLAKRKIKNQLRSLTMSEPGLNNIVLQDWPHGLFSYVVVEVRSNSIEGIPPLIEEVVDILSSREFMIHIIFSSVVIASCGFPFRSPVDTQQRCQAASLAIQKALSLNTRLIYGEVEAMYGSLGGRYCQQVGPVFLDCTTLLCRLRDTEWGAFSGAADFSGST